MDDGEFCTGTIRIDWSISERDLRVRPGEDLLSSDETRAVLDRLEEAIVKALPHIVELYLDGEDRPPMRLRFDYGSDDIFLCDGATSCGYISELRREIKNPDDGAACGEV